MERVIKNKSVVSALRIIELYKDCNNITQDALILGILETIKETDFNRWARIIDITLHGHDTDN